MAANARTVKVTFLGDASQLNRVTSAISTKTGGLGNIAKKAGLAVAAGLAVGGLALAKFGLDSIKAASDLEQSMGAVDSVFGKSAAKVKEYAQTSAMQLGLAKSEYASLSAVVGAQLQSMGVEQDKSAVKSNELITIGADLAATFGGSVSDAVGAVGALLRGERDPIERYGIAIKDADIKARMAAEGTDKLEGKAFKLAQTQTTLKMLTEQAGGALGAFGRESDTLAGKQERLKARFEDTKAALGQRLMPTAVAFADWILTKGVPALETFGRWIESNKDDIANFAVGVGKAVGSIVQAFLLFLQGTLTVLAKATGAYAEFVGFVFDAAGQILKAMELSLGWLPGYKEKFQAAGIALGVYERTVHGKIESTSRGFQKGADMAGVAASAVGGLREKIESLRPKKVDATAKAHGAAEVNALRREINLMRDKTVRVTVVQTQLNNIGRVPHGQRAHGGPVLPGRPYLVGERGPEMIVPKAAGTVLDTNRTANALGGKSDGMTAEQAERLIAGIDALRADTRREGDRRLMLTRTGAL